MAREIRRAAVLGSGVMGGGIAAHLANAGIDVLLYDVVGKDGDRLGIVRAGLAGLAKQKPPHLFRPELAGKITPCNFEDHVDALKTADWIIEVVVERLDIKKKVFAWIAEHRTPGSVVSSNTSGIRLADLSEGLPEELRRNLLVTHFFNPVRYMKLLELVPGPDTDPDVVRSIAAFATDRLGKGIVYGKDTPNFVANRIGTYGMASVFRHMARFGLTVEAVDAIFGPAMGRPKSAIFRTADLVGLDTLAHVLGNVYQNAPDDEERQAFQVPEFVTRLVESGRTGTKSGAGFYKKVKKGGESDFLVVDLQTLEYRPQEKVRFPCIGAARKAESVEDKLRAMVYGAEDDVASQMAWATLADTLIYTANRIPAIADDVVNVDRALRWGFGWDIGIFESWDAVGVRRSVERMKAEGRTVPVWVEEMLQSGRESFYAKSGAGLTYRTRDGEVRDVPQNPRHLVLADRKAAGGLVDRNVGASLVDLGEGVLCLEFHSKMNALDETLFEMYEKALDKLDAGAFDALVVGNQGGRAFCAGANVLMILMAASSGDWASVNRSIDRLQKLMMRARYATRPVVTAPYGLTLGGGAEVSMHSALTVASAELYMGFVEAGVGVIPAAGGCKELMMRYLGEVPQDIDYDPLPYVQRAFERIGLAKVSSSAEDARSLGFLRATDRVVMDGDALLSVAKKAARGLVDGEYQAPQPRTVKVPGTTGFAAVELFLYQMREGGFATEHDVTVGRALGKVLTGGDVPFGAVRTEQDLLDLEREAFLSLCGEKKSQERMQHMLQTGKPLRN